MQLLVKKEFSIMLILGSEVCHRGGDVQEVVDCVTRAASINEPIKFAVPVIEAF